MKRLLIVALAAAALGLLLPGRALASPEQEAAAPQLLNYQGRLTDAAGIPRTGTAAITFNLYVDPTTTTALWTETHSGVVLADGVFAVLLGSLTPFPNNAWTEADRYLGIAIDGGAELVPRLRVASVPFAMESNRLNGKRSTDFEPIGAGAIAAAGVASQLKGNDVTPPNEGSNQVHWNNLYGVPAGFSDGQDNVGEGVAVHGLLQGLDANDHPQYALGATLQTSDNSGPNLGSNRVHWDNLGGVPDPLATGQLPKSWIQPGAIDSTRLGTGVVAGSNLAAGAVGAPQLAAGAVRSAQVQDGSLTGFDVQNGSISGDDLQNGTITGLDVQDESIFTTDIANGAILGADIAAGAIGGNQVAEGALPGSKLVDGTVPGAKLTNASVDGGKLVSGAVGNREIGPNAVSSGNVIDGSLSVGDLSDPPGVKYLNVPGFADSVVSQSGQTLASVTLILPPGPGFVIVNGGAQVYLLHDLGTRSSVTLAVSPSENEVPDESASAISLPGNYQSELYIFPVQMQSVFPVNGPGPATFHVTAKKAGQPRNPTLHNVRLSAIYVKSQY